MKEYLRNKNEYIEDGRLYVESIKSCHCGEKVGEDYCLTCNIMQRGKREYLYRDNGEFISRYRSNKKLWLSEEAKNRVSQAVERFNGYVENSKTDLFTEVVIGELNAAVRYRRCCIDLYEVVLECTSADDVKQTRIYELSSVKGMINKVVFDLNVCFEESEEGKKMLAVLLNPDEKTLYKNPLFMSAVEKGDIFFQLQLKNNYNLADKKETALLSAYLNKPVLPKLPEKFNMRYVVKRKGVDISLLSRSGYEILHRPYFAMMNSTRSNITLNPHTKTGVDAAAFYEEPITFDEFLKLFEEAENNE